MRHLALFLWFWLMACAFAVQAQSIAVRRPMADVGALPLGVDSISYSFILTNAGQEPVSIGWVSTSCDCATPAWPKTAIAPGDSARVRVHFQSREPGPFEKNFTVYDDLRRPVARLTLKGEVQPKPEPLPPGPIRYQMDYNALDTDSGRIFFNNLAVRIKATGVPKKILVHSSASRVPTKKFPNNQALAQERADRAKALMMESLQKQSMEPKSLQWGGSVKVQGPPWKARTPIETYRAYQYVAVEVVY